MGTSIGEALKIQAEELRVRRFQRGEELALKAPIKLLFPMIFFILPVIVLIVVGPVFLNFIRGDLMNLQMGMAGGAPTAGRAAEPGARQAARPGARQPARPAARPAAGR
jgi:hypothetical protein